MNSADFRISDWGPLIFAAILVGLKLLEVVFKKISQAGQKQEDVRVIEEEPPPSQGPYLPYEDVAEGIFGDYIEMRKRKALPPKPAPPPPAPLPAAKPAPIVEDSIVVIEDLEQPAKEPKVLTPLAAEMRRAFVASLIFSRPPGMRRRR